MDEQIQGRTDSLVETEIVENYRIKDLTPTLIAEVEQARSEGANIAPLRRVRFKRLTPRQKSQVNAAYMIQFHADIQNKNILSQAQLRELSIERGSWSVAEEDRIAELKAASTAEMKNLYVEGFDQRENWLEELDTLCTDYKFAIETSKPESEQEKIFAVFRRWVNYVPKEQDEYTTRYAALQGKEKYEVDNDYLFLLENAPTEEAQDALTEIEELTSKVRRLAEIIDQRDELDKLEEKQAKIFRESLESRRERAEQMAILYYGTKVVDEDGKVIGQGMLAPTFDDVWDLPDETVRWLIQEAAMFHQGIPEGARPYLEQWGFIKAEPVTGSSPASDESPVPPTPSFDGEPVQKTPSLTLASAADKS